MQDTEMRDIGDDLSDQGSKFGSPCSRDSYMDDESGPAAAPPFEGDAPPEAPSAPRDYGKILWSQPETSLDQMFDEVSDVSSVHTSEDDGMTLPNRSFLGTSDYATMSAITIIASMEKKDWNAARMCYSANGDSLHESQQTFDSAMTSDAARQMEACKEIVSRISRSLAQASRSTEMTEQARSDIIDEIISKGETPQGYSSEIRSLLLRDPEGKLQGMHGINNKAFNASIPGKVKEILTGVQEEDGSGFVSDFLRDSLGRLFMDDFVNLDSALYHRQEWARRGRGQREGYIIKLILCLQQSYETDDNLVSPAERQAMANLEASQGKGKGKARQ